MNRIQKRIWPEDLVEKVYETCISLGGPSFSRSNVRDYILKTDKMYYDNLFIVAKSHTLILEVIANKLRKLKNIGVLERIVGLHARWCVIEKL